jgi:hypothetical protein
VKWEMARLKRVVLALLLAVATADLPERAGPGDLRLVAAPTATYTSDIGLTLGAGGSLYRASDVPGRLERLTLNAAWASRGPRWLAMRWEEPQVGSLGWGLLGDVRLADDNREPYWGEGAALGGLSTAAGFGAPPDPFRYHDRRAFLSLTARPSRATSPSPYFRARWLLLEVVDAGTLLRAARPRGADGGGEALAEAGLFIDTRDRDVGTHRGLLASCSMFVAPPIGSLSAGGMGGANLSAAIYLPLSRGATLAGRALYDRKVGDVPFYERALYEGMSYGVGMGGAETIRGVARSRISGDEKGLASLEVRAPVANLRAFGGTPLQIGVATGLDVGFARQSGYGAVAAVGGFAGLRALWDRAVLLRLEVGYAGQGGTAVYLATGEQF